MIVCSLLLVNNVIQTSISPRFFLRTLSCYVCLPVNDSSLLHFTSQTEFVYIYRSRWRVHLAFLRSTLSLSCILAVFSIRSEARDARLIFRSGRRSIVSIFAILRLISCVQQ